MGEGKSIYLAKNYVCWRVLEDALRSPGGIQEWWWASYVWHGGVIASALDFQSSCIMFHSWARHFLSVAFSAQESVNEYQQIFRTTWQWVGDLWWVSVPFIGRSKTPSLSMLQTLQQLCAPVMTKPSWSWGSEHHFYCPHNLLVSVL